MSRRSRSTSRDNAHRRRRSSSANSVSSDSILSRESVSEFKLKLLSMESDLDATLRSLTGSDAHVVDIQSASANSGAPSLLISRDSLDGRSLSARNIIAPRSPRKTQEASLHQMKRNVSPVPPSRHSTSESLQGDLNERLETQEKCVQVLHAALLSRPD